MNYKIKGVVLHWAGSTYSKENIEFAKKHYNRVVDHLGVSYEGFPLSAQTPPLREGRNGSLYAAHTRHANSNRAGIVMMGMKGAKEKPFNAGKYPITEASFDGAVRETALICIEHGITVTQDTVETHAGVQPNWGIAQRGKWDVTRLPWRPDLVGYQAVGDHYRKRVNEEMHRVIYGSTAEKPTGLLTTLFKAIAAMFGGK